MKRYREIRTEHDLLIINGRLIRGWFVLRLRATDLNWEPVGGDMGSQEAAEKYARELAQEYGLTEIINHKGIGIQ